MTEDQSVVGRRRIYYDQHCGEALICTDSEEEIMGDEEDKKDFGNNEDHVIRFVYMILSKIYWDLHFMEFSSNVHLILLVERVNSYA